MPDTAPPLKVRDLMTTSVLSVTPNTTAQRVARLILDHAVSAVPVVDGDGTPIGIISETDLVARSSGQKRSRRNFCVGMLAGDRPSADAIGALDHTRTARDIMTAPLVTVDENETIAAATKLLVAHGIKRLPVLKSGRLAGILSRSDLLRAVAGGLATAPAPASGSLLASAFRRIDEAFHAPHRTGGGPAAGAGENVVSAADFRQSVAHFKEQEAAARILDRQRQAEAHAHDIEVVLGTHITEDQWRHILLAARTAAEHGEIEHMALRIPRESCSDNGRAVNVGETGWQSTLRGEAAELALRWAAELKPRGFRLTARTLEYPGGVPGDIGLFLAWGERT